MNRRTFLGSSLALSLSAPAFSTEQVPDTFAANPYTLLELYGRNGDLKLSLKIEQITGDPKAIRTGYGTRLAGYQEHFRLQRDAGHIILYDGTEKSKQIAVFDVAPSNLKINHGFANKNYGVNFPYDINNEPVTILWNHYQDVKRLEIHFHSTCLIGPPDFDRLRCSLIVMAPKGTESPIIDSAQLSELVTPNNAKIAGVMSQNFVGRPWKDLGKYLGNGFRVQFSAKKSKLDPRLAEGLKVPAGIGFGDLFLQMRNAANQSVMLQWERDLILKGSPLTLPSPYSAGRIPVRIPDITALKLSSAEADCPFPVRLVHRSPLDLLDPIERHKVKYGDAILRVENLPLAWGADAIEVGIFGPHRAAVQRVRAGTPVSLVPELTPGPAKVTDCRWFLLLHSRAGKPFVPRAAAPMKPRPSLPPARSQTEAPYPFPSPDPILDEVACDARLALFPNHDGTPPLIGFHWTPEPPSYNDDLGTDPMKRLVGYARYFPKEVTTHRVGSLDLSLTTTIPTEIAIGRDQSPNDKIKQKLSQFGDRFLNLLTYIPLTVAVPAGQDPLEGDTFGTDRDAPLVITPTALPGKARFLLAVEEKFDARTSAALKLKLISLSTGEAADAKRETLFVLDPQPLLIAAVQFQNPLLFTISSGTLLGYWDLAERGGAGWRLLETVTPAEGAGKFTLILPPQTIGEAMLRRGESIKGADGLLDFRLSPPGRFDLRSTPLSKSYPEVAWNLRKILGRPGDLDPGARIDRLRFELLYGIATSVESSGELGLRLAEISARLGALASELGEDVAWKERATDIQVTEYKHAQLAWTTVRKAYRSRLSVLEPWGYGRAQGNPTGEEKPVSLPFGKNETGLLIPHKDKNKVQTDSVSFVLRAKADTKLPYPPPRVLTEAEEEAEKAKLSGGPLWAIESKNIYETLLRTPTSTGGYLARPYFSSLGGWGYQRAQFDENRTAIVSDTTMGRVSYYCVERIGRIGVFYNRARHVIVFERTTLPSAQFGKSQGKAYEGVPLIRKVREYIQILEKSRSYPDHKRGNEPLPDGLPAGFVAACTFAEDIIPVDSTWGRDVDGKGWCIPLWNPIADASIYPRPDIRVDLVTATLGIDVGTVTSPKTEAYRLKHPDQVVFYTSTQPGIDSDTNTWEAARSVDFADAPPPAAPKLPSGDPALAARLLPDPPAMPPGHAAFTFEIEPGGAPINLVAGHQKTGNLTAMVRTFTLQRAQVLPKGNGGAVADKARATTIELQALRDAAETALHDTLFLIPDVSGDVASAAAKAATYITDQRKLLKTRFDNLRIPDSQHEVAWRVAGDIISAKERTMAVLKAEEEAAKTVFAASGAASADAAEAAVRPLVEVGAVLLSGTDSLRGVGARAQRAVEGAEAEFQAVHRDLGVRSKSLADGSYLTPVLTRAKSAAKAAGNLTEQIDAIFAPLEGGVAFLTEVYQPVFTDARQRSVSLLDTLEGEINSLGVALPAGLLPAIKVVRTTIADAFAAIAAAIAVAQNHLNTQIAEIKAGWRATVPTSAEIDAAFNEWQNLARSLGTDITAKINALLVSVTQAIVAVKMRVNDLANKVTSKLAPLDDPVKSALALITDLTSLVRNAPGMFNKVLHDQVTAIDAAFAFPAMPTPIPITQANQQKIADYLGDATTGALRELLPPGAAAIQKEVEDYLKESGGRLTQLASDLREEANQKGQTAIALVNSALADGRRAFEPFLADAQQRLREDAAIATGLYQKGDAALHLVAAFGEAPRVADQVFNRQNLFYAFTDPGKVDISPATALVGRVGGGLKAVGITLPAVGFDPRGMIPDDLAGKAIDVLMKELGGLSFLNLFSDLKLPKIDREQIKITHEIDRNSLRGALHLALDIPFGNQETVVFAKGPLAVRLRSASFKAKMTVGGALTGDAGAERSGWGEIAADWVIAVGGLEIVTFRETTLHYEMGGGLRFDLSPDRITLAPALDYIRQIIEQFKIGGDTFRLELLQENGVPTGAAATLALPVPNLTFGASEITGLRLDAAFRLQLKPSPAGMEVSIGLLFGLGRRDAPFALTIGIFAGGGSIEVGATYLPLQQRASAEVTIRINAGVHKAISIGPIDAEVGIFFGTGVSFVAASGQSPMLRIEQSILIHGRANVLGFITIELVIFLAVVVTQTGRISGYGRFKLSIKIGWFFKFEFETEYEHVIREGSQSVASSSSARPALVAQSDAIAHRPEEYAYAYTAMLV